jgi:hypothetical protein
MEILKDDEDLESIWDKKILCIIKNSQNPIM